MSGDNVQKLVVMELENEIASKVLKKLEEESARGKQQKVNPATNHLFLAVKRFFIQTSK